MLRKFCSVLRFGLLASIAAVAALTFPALHGTALAQASATATKKLDLQAGGEFVLTNSDYYTNAYFKGYGAYASLDFFKHFGAELDFRQANGPSGTYERTYEVGGRYVRQYGHLHPYGKAMIGRGVWNAPPFPGSNQTEGNLAYNMFGVGGGLDYNLNRFLNLRGDFEYQKWGSDPVLLPSGISPYVISFGAAYHFH